MAMGNVLQQALAGAPSGAAPPPMPTPPMAQLPPPPPPVAPPMMQHADAAHHAKAQQFAHAAIADFIKGGITRQHLADALADQDAYDYPNWKKQNVIHPTQAGIGHGMPPPEPDVTLHTPPRPIQGAGSI